MKYSEMKEVFQKEISFLEMITEYESGLEPISNLMDAAEEIRSWKADGYDEFPESFDTSSGPSILMSVWNTFITPDENTKKAIKDEEWDERTKAEHPDWLAFDYYYQDRSTLFVSTESIEEILRQHNYDSAHCELITAALKAYHQNYMENI